MASFPVGVSVSSLLVRNQSWHLGSTLSPGWFYLKILNESHLQRPYFQTRAHSEVLVGRGWAVGHYSAAAQVLQEWGWGHLGGAGKEME